MKPCAAWGAQAFDLSINLATNSGFVPSVDDGAMDGTAGPQVQVSTACAQNSPEISPESLCVADNTQLAMYSIQHTRAAPHGPPCGRVRAHFVRRQCVPFVIVQPILDGGANLKPGEDSRLCDGSCCIL